MIYHYNYVEDYLDYNLALKFQGKLQIKPTLMTFNTNQKYAFISAKEDIFFLNFNHDPPLEIDLDGTIDIQQAKAVLYHNGSFFIFANK